MDIYTIGHSTHPLEELLAMLRTNGVTRLVDIRTVPRSRHNPQYEQTALIRSLPEAGIEYIYLKALGGLRPRQKDSLNLGWRNESFRNFADYMQTEDFEAVLEELIRLAGEKPTAIMCAEAVPWRCHRSLVADALLARGIQVQDIMGPTSTKPHELTRFAKVEGMRVSYPAEEDHG